MLKASLFLALALVISSEVSATPDKVVCYHGTWAHYRSGNGNFEIADIDTNICTHVIYTFVGLEEATGNVILLDEWLDIDLGFLAGYQELRERNKDIKLIVAIGGWNEGSTKYSNVVANETLRGNLVKSAVEFLQTYEFDGFDLDWEYPARRGGVEEDKENFSLLVKELREEFDKYGYLLSAAVSVLGSTVDISYEVPVLSENLDWITLMTYDFYVGSDPLTGHNSPLYPSSSDTNETTRAYNIDTSVLGWIERGADPKKLNLGVPMYGHAFTLANVSDNGVGAPSSGAGPAGPYTAEAGVLSYLEICEKQAEGGWTTVWDDDQQVPYTVKDDQWVSFDNAESITLKVEYAVSKKLGGISVWSLESEDHDGICGEANPLLNAINDVVKST